MAKVRLEAGDGPEALALLGAASVAVASEPRAEAEVLAQTGDTALRVGRAAEALVAAVPATSHVTVRDPFRTTPAASDVTPNDLAMPPPDRLSRLTTTKSGARRARPPSVLRHPPRPMSCHVRRESVMMTGKRCSRRSPAGGHPQARTGSRRTR